MDREADLRARLAWALEDVPDLGQVLRGSVRERFVRCGRDRCHCNDSRKQGHGPVYYLSVSLGTSGTKQMALSRESYELARQYARNYERLWEIMENVSAINRELLRLRRATDTRDAR